MDKQPVAGIVGGNSLLGREIRDLLPEAGFRTRLIGADKDESGLLTEDAGEPVVMTALDEETISGSSVIFLAGSLEASARAVEMVSRVRERPPVIDLTYALDDRPGACLRAPAAEPACFAAPHSGHHVVAHPAAIVLGMLLPRLRQITATRRSIVHVFEPASERGQRGLEELEKQTVGLLTFAELPKHVFDEQVGFNMLARYGPDAQESLENVEQRIERHLATLLALHKEVATPSLRVIHAPVFNGHSFSVWTEFEEQPDVARIQRELGTAQIDVRGQDLDPPNNVAMAGQSGVSVGALAPDRNNPRACWLWAACDNIRISAENAVAVARGLVARGSSGRPQ